MEPSGERSVKPKVIVEYHNSENLDEFIQELKEIYLETDMNKKDAEEELAGTRENLTRFMNQFNKDPRRAHPNLTECERASLAHVDPDVNLGEEAFYFPHRGECPTVDEHKQAQPGSGYSIKLPLGLKKLRSHDDPKIIRAYADILGSLMQPTDRPPVDYLNMHEFTSSIAINMLTLNHGNLTRNPKLHNREVRNMPMKDRPIVKMMMQNSAHILCLNEADAFFSPNDEKSRELIKTFIRYGYKGIVIQTDRMLCPRRTLWQDTFPPGARIGEPHSECSDVSSELKEIALIPNTKFRPRIAWQPQEHPCLLNPRSTLDRDCQHAPLSKDMAETRRSSFSTSSRVMSFVA